MTTTDAPRLSLTLAPAWPGGGPLLVGQAAEFELRLRNVSAGEVVAKGFSGDLQWPVVVLAGDAGAPAQRFDERAARRAAGLPSDDLRGSAPPPTPLAAGTERALRLDLWRYTPAHGPGRYRVHAEHAPSAEGRPLVSDEVAFEIVAARVARCAAGYGWLDHATSVLAWLAEAPAGRLRLLIRASTPAGHATAAGGAAAAGEFPAGASVALSHAAQAPTRWLRGWVAVLAGDALTLVSHQLGRPQATVALGAHGLDDAALVPHFPDLDARALVLLTGRRAGAPVLAGWLHGAGGRPPARWEVALAHQPQAVALVAAADESFTLVYSADDGTASRLQRLRVALDGRVLEREKTLATSPRRTRVLTAVSTLGRPPLFVLVESARDAGAPLTLTRIALDGGMKASEPFTPAGWPQAAITAWAADMDARGSIALALLDEQGRLHAGRIDRTLRPLQAAAPLQAVHVACLAGGAWVGAFGATGLLVTAPVPEMS